MLADLTITYETGHVISSGVTFSVRCAGLAQDALLCFVFVSAERMALDVSVYRLGDGDCLQKNPSKSRKTGRFLREKI